MVTAGDEYLLHRTPWPVARPMTSDTNFYDRYFSNGYPRDGVCYFAAALGLYPNLGVIDAAFSVLVDDRQRTVRASSLLRDRLAARVGPIALEVLEPLRRLRLTVDQNPRKLAADLVFDARPAVRRAPLLPRESHWRGRDGLHPLHPTRLLARLVHGRRPAFRRVPRTMVGKPRPLLGDPSRRKAGATWRTPSRAAAVFLELGAAQFRRPLHTFHLSEEADGSRWHESGAILRPFPEGSAYFVLPSTTSSSRREPVTSSGLRSCSRLQMESQKR